MVYSRFDIDGIFLDSVVDEAALVAIRLKNVLADSEEAVRAHLATQVTSPQAELLGACLERLGWWLPDDECWTPEQLELWLCRDDETRAFIDDKGEECIHLVTPAKRILEAVEGIVSLASAVQIDASSCLTVARFVREKLQWMSQGGMQLPLGPRIRRRGSPDYIRFAASDIRFDGERLNAALNAVAIQLGLPPGRLEWQTSNEYNVVNRAYKDVKSLLSHWRNVLDEQIQTRKELPPGWEFLPGSTAWPQRAWPVSPIQNVEHLRGWLAQWQETIYAVRAITCEFVASPESDLEDIRRELRNTRRALREWGVSLPTGFDDKPADINDAERQLEALIDAFSMTADESEKFRSGGDSLETPTPEVGVGPVKGTKPAKISRAKNAIGGRTSNELLLIAALTKHHEYSNGGCGRTDPIGNNALARLAGIPQRNASTFYKKQFGGHEQYTTVCKDSPRLVAALRALNSEFRPRDFYSARTPTEVKAESDSKDSDE